jgi:hypothetical protein
MPKTQPNNAAIIDKCTQRLRALKSHVPDLAIGIDINGTPYTAAGVVALYQDCLDVRSELIMLRANLQATITRREQIEAKRRAADRALKPWVVNKFGEGSAPAHDFGFPPPRVTELTVEQKRLAAERRLATRKARHTMGRRQKEKIRGTVESGSEAGEVDQTPSL